MEPLKAAFSEWLEDYHHRFHDSLGCSPLNKRLDAPKVTRPLPDVAQLDLFFGIEERRNVHRNGTLHLQRKVYGVKGALPGSIVDVQYLPWDLSVIYIGPDKIPAKPVDLIKNARRHEYTHNQAHRMRPLWNPLQPFHGYCVQGTIPISEPFTTKGETLLLERMLILLGQGKSFSLTGEPGSGKSMLLKALLGNLKQKAFRHALIPYSGLKQNPLLREICEKLAIDTTGRSSLLGRFQPLSNFIRYRLKAAKANPELFSKEAMKLIELDSKGNRRVIMNMAGNCMDLAVLREEKRITEELAREVCDQA